MPLTINNQNINISSWITQLLIQELNENNPVTTEIILNYLNNINDTPIHDTLIHDTHPNDTPLYDTPIHDTPLYDTLYGSTGGNPNVELYYTDYSSYNNSPSSIIDFPNHIIP